MSQRLRGGLFLIVVFWIANSHRAYAGPVFLTGHDPDFHATQGANTAGARNLLSAGVSFILNPVLNPFAASGNSRVLFVESFGSPAPACTQGVDGLVALGLSSPQDFEKHAADTLSAELDLLGTKYAGVVVASDHGGNLRQAELDLLNARRADIATFVRAGGGLMAMGESNQGCNNTPDGGHFGFVPSAISSVSVDQNEVGFVVTPFGGNLGLTAGDVNGNVAHNVFDQVASNFSVVDVDGSARVITIAGPDAATSVECGNGVVEPGEACDDGNQQNGDGCEDDVAAGGTCTLTCPPCCGNGIVESGEQCDDGGTVVGDCCSPTCQFEVSGTLCDDGVSCTQPDLCDGRGACIGQVPPACVDGDPCTVDSCDVSGCLNVAAPRPHCLAAERSSFQVKLPADAGRARISWKLKKGPAFGQFDLGDPLHTTTFTLCVYDESANVPRLAGSLAVGPSISWKSRAPRGWKYKDRTGAQSGVTQLQFVSGAKGRTRVQLTAGGAAQGWPTPFSSSAIFDQSSRVTVQLSGSERQTCWTSEFAAPAKKNVSDQFKDIAPQ